MTKGTKKKNGKKNLFILIGVIIVGLFLLLQVQVRKSSNLEDYNSKKVEASFTSRLLKFKVNYYKEFEVVEKYNDVIFLRDEGKIDVSVVGTNFDNLDDYIEDLEIKNNFSLSNKDEKKMTNGHVSGEIVVKNGNSEYVHFIYPEGSWSVYILSTTSPELYDDLDQIAESFEYTGE